MVSYLIAGSGTVTVYVDGRSYTANPNHPNYRAVRDALRNRKFDNLVKLMDVAQAVMARMGEKTKVENGKVFYNGAAVHNVVADRILDFMRENFDHNPLVKFLDNLMENPSDNSRENLYRFLEHNKHPITEDGCFLAYKRVDTDYKDLYKHEFDNSPGKTVTMPRESVNSDSNQTCSHGLHVAALDYAANSYGGGQGCLVVVKVNPKNVVAVPTDYNNQKMRVCEYTVLEDYRGTPTTQAEVAKPYNPTEVTTYRDENGVVHRDEVDAEDYLDECPYCGYPVDECCCEDDNYDSCPYCGYPTDDCECDSEDEDEDYGN
jgi:hypothetical protein